MNNSFERLIDGMCATLRAEVLTRLDDEFARGQVFGVINLLNTFKARADWSAGFLLQQIEVQRLALAGLHGMVQGHPVAATLPTQPATVPALAPQAVAIADLMAQRESGNRALASLVGWLGEQREQLGPELAQAFDKALRDAMRAEVEIELKHAPRPLFAEISSGRED